MMNVPKSLLAMISLTAACAGAPATSPARAADAPTSADAARVRLYALDCGRIEISDFGFFTDAGKPTGQGRTLADPCFVVRHPKGTLLWDTGLSESIASEKNGRPNPVGREIVDGPLLHDQLASLSLKPADVTFVGVSHLHADHAGNLNLFTSSTWLLGRKEIAAATATPPPLGVDPKAFSEYRNVKTKLLDADEDVFGDGSVRIIQTPGHTAGHQSLVVKLARTGTLVFSGDLAHSRDNWEKGVVPSFNYSREETLASIARAQRIVAEAPARFIVQHSVEDFRSLPKFPAYLD